MTDPTRADLPRPADEHPRPLPAVRRTARPRHLTHALLAVAIVLASIVGLATPRDAAAWAAGTFSSTSESQLLTLTNQARANAGLRALVLDTALRTEARSRSKDMIDNNYFSHSIPPDGHTVFTELKAMGYCYTSAGENIGWNTYPDDSATQQVQDAFMSSTSHRNNILGLAWTVIGIGAYQGTTDKKMWTVLFAAPCRTATPAPTATPPRTATPKPASTPRPTATRTPTPIVLPAPTDQPSSTPTPEPTIEPSPTPDLSFGPDPNDPAPIPGWLMPPISTYGPSSTPAPTAAPAPAASGLRVMDPPQLQGLFESIVGGVTGVFFGS